MARQWRCATSRSDACLGGQLLALVKEFLVELVSEEPSSLKLEREEHELRARIRTFTASNRLSRDEAHRRER